MISGPSKGRKSRHETVRASHGRTDARVPSRSAWGDAPGFTRRRARRSPGSRAQQNRERACSPAPSGRTEPDARLEVEVIRPGVVELRTTNGSQPPPLYPGPGVTPGHCKVATTRWTDTCGQGAPALADLLEQRHDDPLGLRTQALRTLFSYSPIPPPSPYPSAAAAQREGGAPVRRRHPGHRQGCQRDRDAGAAGGLSVLPIGGNRCVAAAPGLLLDHRPDALPPVRTAVRAIAAAAWTPTKRAATWSPCSEPLDTPRRRRP